jgi:hypothetical protein
LPRRSVRLMGRWPSTPPRVHIVFNSARDRRMP